MRNNAENIVALYFEADRSGVRKRYDSLFELTEPPKHNGDEESSSDFGLDAKFGRLVEWVGVSNDLVEPLERRWNHFDDFAKHVALHYMRCLRDDSYTLEHAIEGLIKTFTVWDVSPFLHALVPESTFPVDGELSHCRLCHILDELGITFEDSTSLTDFEVWSNLSVALAEWGVDRKLAPWQRWAAVYDLGPRLLDPPPAFPANDKPRVWVIATNDSFNEFEVIDSHGSDAVGTWAINKNARRGDLALMYCVKPRSAIVSVYRVLEDAHRDPFGGWNGHRAEVGEKISLPWISFAEMKKDDVLSEWKLVRGNFQGLLHHEVPESAWERIKHIVSEKDIEAGERLSALGRAAKGVRELRVSGEQWSEKDVEDRLVIPLLEQLGWELGRTLVQQVEMMIKVGSGRPQKAIADFVGYSGELTSDAVMVLEAKRRIASTRELEYAAQQAESYAGRLRSPTFAVAAPEGLWVYELKFPGQSRLLANFALESQPVEQLAAKLRGILGFPSLVAE